MNLEIYWTLKIKNMYVCDNFKKNVEMRTKVWDLITNCIRAIVYGRIKLCLQLKMC